jgi:hypothetical protein
MLLDHCDPFVELSLFGYLMIEKWVLDWMDSIDLDSCCQLLQPGNQIEHFKASF